MSEAEKTHVLPQREVYAIDGGDPLTPQQLLAIPVFKGVSPKYLEENRGSVVQKTFKPGEIVCREGDEGDTAFLLLHGKVDIYINTLVSHVKTRPETKGSWFKKITSTLHRGPKEQKKTNGHTSYIPIDSPVDLPMNNPVAQLEEGDLFGEMTCLNLYPRSATVRAAEDCVLLEMRRNILKMLLRNKEFKAQIDEKYKKRTLDNHLRTVDFLRDVPDDAIEFLKAKCELVTFEPGAMICREGEVADAFFLVRMGHVKVSQKYPGGEMVIAYLGRGKFFGAIGLLIEPLRVATCTASDTVQLVRISKEDFLMMMDKYPQSRVKVLEVETKRLDENKDKGFQLKRAFLNDAQTQSIMGATNLLVMDLEKCTRCDDCVRACATAHDGVTRLIRSDEEDKRYDKFLLAKSCRRCVEPACMLGCPVGSIVKGESKEIIIEDWCIGCGLCAKSCPYSNINMHTFEDTKDLKKLEVKATNTTAHTVTFAAKHEWENATVVMASFNSGGLTSGSAYYVHAVDEQTVTFHKTAPDANGGRNPVHLTGNVKASIQHAKIRAVVCDLCTAHGAQPSCVYACPHGAMRLVEPAIFLGIEETTLAAANKS